MFIFTEQFTEMQESIKTFSKESAIEITEVHETNVEVGEVKSTEFELMALSTVCG